MEPFTNRELGLLLRCAGNVLTGIVCACVLALVGVSWYQWVHDNDERARLLMQQDTACQIRYGPEYGAGQDMRCHKKDGQRFY